MAEITPDDIPSGPLVGKPLLYFTSGFVSLGVFLFGYDQGYMSGIITGPYFKEYFNNPSSATIGTVVAILEIGALISSLLGHYASDRLGRRKTIRLGAFIFMLGGTMQSHSSTVVHLFLGRFISGLGVGLLSGNVPVYQAEVSPPDSRGFLGCVQFTGNVLGYSSSVWIDYACSFIESDLSWRVPLVAQVVFGTILFLGSFLIVESPRWLLEHDHDAEGLVVIADLYSNGEVHSDIATDEFRSIKEMVLMNRLEGELSYSETFRRYPKRLFIAMSAQMFAQFNGINVISYYAPLVFEKAGWVGRNAILMTGINSLIYVSSTVPPWYLVENWGRRPIFISGGLLMGLSLLSVAFVSYLDLDITPQLVVIFVIIYNSSFGYSWGPLGWLMVEILPAKARAKGSSMSTATNWLCNFIVGELSPILLDLISYKLYLIHAASCFISIITVFYVYPETKGLSLEDMDSIFDDRSSVHSHNAFGASNSSLYGSISNNGGDVESLSSSRFMTNSQAARKMNNLGLGGNQMLPSEINALVQGNTSIHSVTSNSHLRSPLILPENIEPPDLAAIYAYKTSDENSIRGSLRKGSEAVSSIFGSKKRKDGNATSDDEESVRFLE